MGRESRRQKPLTVERMRQSRHPAVSPSGRTLADHVSAVAIHEAGHVVTAWCLGFELHYAIVEVTRVGGQVGIHGYTELIDRPRPDESPEQARARLSTPERLRASTIQVVAGWCAEQRVHTHRADLAASAADDREAAEKLALYAMGPGPHTDLVHVVDAYLEDCEREAQTLLSQHAASVIAVADWLMQHQNERVSSAVLLARCEDGRNAHGDG